MAEAILQVSRFCLAQEIMLGMERMSLFVKPHIGSSNFRKAFALAKDQQDAMTQFRKDVQTAFDSMSDIDQTALSANFTNTPQSFNEAMSFCMVTLGEIFQEEFNADWKRDAKQQYANIPLVAVAVLPYKHKFIAKKGNHRTGALVEQQIGCSRIEKYHHLMNRAAKDLMSILGSIILSGNPAIQLFINFQLSPINIHKRMEETRAMLRNHYLIQGDSLMKQWMETIERVGNVPPNTPGFGGAVTAPATIGCLDADGRIQQPLGSALPSSSPRNII